MRPRNDQRRQGRATQGVASGTDKERHDDALNTAIKERKLEKVREMCATAPLGDGVPPPFNMVFKRWENVGVQQRACDALHADFDAKVKALADSKGVQTGGGRCLLAAQDLFRETNREPSGPWETADARRASIAPVTEGCLSAVEALVADGKTRTAYLMLRGALPDPERTVLTPAQLTRWQAAWAAAWQGAAFAYEMSAEAVDSPHAPWPRSTAATPPARPSWPTPKRR